MAAYEVLLLNTAIPQIQAAQSGDTYLVPRDIAFSAALTLSAGTANGVPYLNASKVLTTGSALTFDGTNFNVVRAAATDQYMSLYADGTGPTLKFFGGAAGKIAGIMADSASASMYFTNEGNKPFVYAINGSEQMRLTSTGLGIGTSSPAVKLDVVGNATVSNGDITVGTAGKFLYSNYVAQNSGSSLYLRGATASGQIEFQTNTTTKATLDSSGNLGLGVTPSAWASTHKAYQLSGGGGLYNNGADGYLNLANNFYYDGADWRRVTAAPASTYLQSSSGHLWGYVGTGTANSVCGFPSAQMTLDSSGNLGLGVTPSAWRTAGGEKAIQVGPTLTAYSNSGGDVYWNKNWFLNSSAQIVYLTNGYAQSYGMVNGEHRFYIAPSGTANSASVTSGASYTVVALGTTTLGEWQTLFSGLGSLPSLGQVITATATGSIPNGGLVTQNISFTQAMTLDASGNLAIGTTSIFTNPRLSVYNGATLTTGGDSGGNGVLIAAATGAASSGQLVVAGSDTAAIDKGGAIVFAGKWDTATNNIAQWAKIVGYKENATNNNYAGYLGFYTRADGGAATEAARITSGGDLLVGTQTSSDYRMRVDAAASTHAGVFVGPTAGYASIQVVNTAASGTRGLISFRTSVGGSEVGSVTTDGTNAAYNTSSDYRLKDNQQPLTGSGAFIDALKPKTWDWKSGGKGVGFIAHEVAEVSPGTVVGEKDAVDANGKPIMQAMEYGSAEFIANIIAELQSLRARVAQLEQGA